MGISENDNFSSSVEIGEDNEKPKLQEEKQRLNPNVSLINPKEIKKQANKILVFLKEGPSYMNTIFEFFVINGLYFDTSDRGGSQQNTLSSNFHVLIKLLSPSTFALTSACER